MFDIGFLLDYDTPVAVISYVVNATHSGALSTFLFIRESEVALVVDPYIRHLSCLSNCTTLEAAVQCEEAKSMFVSDRTCCTACESLVEYHYRLDYGIYLLKLRQYQLDTLRWQSGT